MCKALISAEEKLNELDRGSGDGDCGSTLKAGAIGECEYKEKNYSQNLQVKFQNFYDCRYSAKVCTVSMG